MLYTDGTAYYAKVNGQMVQLQLVQVNPLPVAAKPAATTPAATTPAATTPARKRQGAKRGHTRVHKGHDNYEKVRAWRVGEPCPWDGAAYAGAEATARKGKRKHTFACGRHSVNRYRPGV